MILEAALYYNGILMIIFGFILLLTTTVANKMLQRAGINSKDYTERNYMIYRISGIWVITAGVVCTYVTYYLELKYQKLVCILMIIAHITEIIVKKIGIPESGASFFFANGHLALILLTSLIFS